MHYKNGREAKAGDKVIQIPSMGTPRAGVLYDPNGSSDCCNGRLARVSDADPYINIKDCLHVNDIAAASIPDTTPAPVAAPEAVAAN